MAMPLMQMARSLVMNPASMVSTQTASRAWAKTCSSVFLSRVARCSSPRVQAKIEAAENYRGPVKCVDIQYKYDL